MNKFFKDMTTGKDNETHDLVRVLTLVVSIVMVISFIAAAFTYLYGYFYSLSHTDAKMFDMQTFFNAESLGVAAIGPLLKATILVSESRYVATKANTSCLRIGIAWSGRLVEVTAHREIIKRGRIAQKRESGSRHTASEQIRQNFGKAVR